MAHTLRSQGLVSPIIISDRQYDFFADFDVEVMPYCEGDELKQVALFEPDFIYTGTSYTSTIELRFLEQARAKNIFSCSFVDHYSKLLERFQLNDKLVFPSSVAVIDDTAFDKAIQSGLPAELLVVTGNPYHQYISKWQPSVGKKQFFEGLGLDPAKKMILYAPDPLTNVGGKEKYGCDEVMALETILDCLGENKNNIHIIVKPHPNQNLKLFEKYTDRSSVTVLTFVHLNTLIYYSDVVVSFFSNILIEAGLLGAKSCRLLINFKGDDYLNESRYNNIKKVTTHLDLVNLLNTL